MVLADPGCDDTCKIKHIAFDPQLAAVQDKKKKLTRVVSKNHQHQKLKDDF